MPRRLLSWQLLPILSVFSPLPLPQPPYAEGPPPVLLLPPLSPAFPRLEKPLAPSVTPAAPPHSASGRILVTPAPAPGDWVPWLLRPTGKPEKPSVLELEGRPFETDLWGQVLVFSCELGRWGRGSAILGPKRWESCLFSELLLPNQHSNQLIPSFLHLTFHLFFLLSRKDFAESLLCARRCLSSSF